MFIQIFFGLYGIWHDSDLTEMNSAQRERLFLFLNAVLSGCKY